MYALYDVHVAELHKPCKSDDTFCIPGNKNGSNP